MKPIRPSEIRVWHRPGAVAWWWALRLLAAWLLAAPVADILSAPTASLPRGDAVLFEPGGAYLLECLRHTQAQLAAGTRRTLWALLLLGTMNLIPLSAVLVALSHRGRLRPNEWSQLTARHVPAFLMLAGLTLFAQAVVLLGMTLVATTTRETLHHALGPRNADLTAIAAAAAGVALAAGLGVLQDLARAAAVRHEVGGRAALSIALDTVRQRPGRALVDWLTPAVYTLPVVTGAAVVTSWLRVDRDGSWRVALVFLVHQVAAFGLVALRSWWLARALVLVSAHDASVAGEHRHVEPGALRPGKPQLADRLAGTGE